ncbi:hypothetical protein AB1484_37960 [Parafrankia sp. FMc6]
MFLAVVRSGAGRVRFGLSASASGRRTATVDHPDSPGLAADPANRI